MNRFLSLPRLAFNPEYVAQAPQEPGVYGLFEGSELIYVGSASSDHSIRDCLRRHLDGECTKVATHYACEVTPRASALETEILAGFKQLIGRAPRCQQKGV